MKGWKKTMVFSIITSFLICSTGCGIRTGSQGEESVSDVTGGSVYIEQGIHSEMIQSQWEVLAKNDDKWRLPGDHREESLAYYAVTDLDQNGRLEIIRIQYQARLGKYVFMGLYETNSSLNGIREVNTDLVGKNLDVCDLEEMDTAYYDWKTGKCHYMIGGKLQGAVYQNIYALTLEKGQLSRTSLAYQTNIQGKNGEQNCQYFLINGSQKKKMDQTEYSKQNVGDVVYKQCGRMSVKISPFSFCHPLEDMIEGQTRYALEQSYQNFSLGMPLQKKSISLCGRELEIPQYTAMQDQKKQDRINRMITDEVSRSLNMVYDLSDPKWDIEHVTITVKYASRDRISLLLLSSGYYEGAAHGNEYCDTINIDLEQERLLSGEELLSKQYRSCLEENILAGYYHDMLGNGGDYLDYIVQNDFNLFHNTVSEGWKDVKIYQTSDKVGVVIQTRFGRDAYVIYEVRRDWEQEDGNGVHYSEVDWDAYQYKLLAREYQELQDYMPVLAGEKSLIWISEDYDGDGKKRTRRKEMLISEFFEEYGESGLMQDEYWLDYISVCDITQDGGLELVLHFTDWGGFYLILHREGNQFYATDRGERSFQGLQADGVYFGSGGAFTSYVYRMKFDGNTFVEKLIGQRDYGEYEIEGRKVGEAEFAKWEHSRMNDLALRYVPQILQK